MLSFSIKRRANNVLLINRRFSPIKIKAMTSIINIINLSVNYKADDVLILTVFLLSKAI